MGKECPSYALCADICAEGAIEHTEDGIKFHTEKCVGCLACFGIVSICGVGGLPDDFFDVTAAAIADSALAVVKAIGAGKVGYINLAVDISPHCDCVNYSDRPIVPNLGVFASWDPVALDSACINKTKNAYGIPGSAAMEKGVMEPGMAKLTACGSVMGISEEIQPNVGQQIGLGIREYELVDVPPALDPTPFLCDPQNAGLKLRRVFAKKGDIYPKGGFKRVHEVDIEDMRLP